MNLNETQQIRQRL